MEKVNSDEEMDYSEDEENESDDDSDWQPSTTSVADTEKTFNVQDINQSFLMEITDILNNHGHVNYENALALNMQLQQRLLDVRKRLQTLLQSVQERYVANEKRLKENIGRKKDGVGMRGAYLKGGTFYFKGNMFFKDLNCRNCPNNTDYEQRKSEGEMFPMDFELCGRHVWSMVDKLGIVQAIKEQITDYLQSTKTTPGAVSSETAKIERKISVHSQTLVQLLAKVDQNFIIDWEQISIHNLHHRHSPTSCKTMWQVYLHPSLSRKPWTMDERTRLLEVARENRFQNWQKIALAVGKRSDYQCFIEYQTSACQMEPDRWTKWNKKDDQRLLEVIEKNTVNGVIKWNAVASYFPQKSKAALNQRYLYSVDPKISHAPFTPEEDLMLLAAVEEYGDKFSGFPRTLFPNRSIVQLRSRYRNTLHMRHSIAPWTIEDDKKLMEFVAEHGTSSWLRCSQTLGNHSRIKCRTRFLTIQRFFKKQPNATLEDLPRKKECRVKNSVITTKNWTEKLAELRDNPDVDLKPPKPPQQEKSEPKKRVPAKREKKTIVEKPARKNVKEKTAKTLKTKNKKSVVKIKTEAPPKPERRERNVPYVNRLRAVGLNMYNFFKYSYNFRLGRDPCIRVPGTSLHTVANTMGLCLSQYQNFVHDYTMPLVVRQRCKAYLHRHVPDMSWLGYLMPPNWSTALAFRALCIQAAQSVSVPLINEQPVLDDHVSIQLFRQRFKALLYTTALLSRLNPGQFPNLQRPIMGELKKQEASLKEQELATTEGQQAFTLKEEMDCENIELKTETPVGSCVIANARKSGASEGTKKRKAKTKTQHQVKKARVGNENQTAQTEAQILEDKIKTELEM